MQNRCKGKIELDNRISKYDFGAQKAHIMNMEIVEKRLMRNASVQNEPLTIHNFIDMKFCYDRKLLNFSSIIEELVRVERGPTKTASKASLRLKQHAYVSCGISKRYSDKKAELDGVK